MYKGALGEFFKRHNAWMWQPSKCPYISMWYRRAGGRHDICVCVKRSRWDGKGGGHNSHKRNNIACKEHQSIYRHNNNNNSTTWHTIWLRGKKDHLPDENTNIKKNKGHPTVSPIKRRKKVTPLTSNCKEETRWSIQKLFTFFKRAGEDKDAMDNDELLANFVFTIQNALG